MEIGIIGTGAIGKAYARTFAKKGLIVNCCDLPEKRDSLENELTHPNIRILDNGVDVSKRSDIVFYLTPTEVVSDAIANYGSSTKMGAIVSAGTSVMTPAIESFKRHLRADVNIINWHWLFGPSLSPVGRNSILANYRSTDGAYRRARDVFELVGTKINELGYVEHDKKTADTQVVTQVGYESMGLAWANVGVYPWEDDMYSNWIDAVKILMTLRLFKGQSHVYSGLAMFNPFAPEQVSQYSQSVKELFGMSLSGEGSAVIERLNNVREYTLKNANGNVGVDVIKSFCSNGNVRLPNSDISVIAMADAWCKLGINPEDNMVCSTPLYNLKRAIVQGLFSDDDLFYGSVDTLLDAHGSIRKHDLAFALASQDWSSIISCRAIKGYQERFESVQSFFGSEKLDDGFRKSSELIENYDKELACKI